MDVSKRYDKHETWLRVTAGTGFWPWASLSIRVLIHQPCLH